MLKTMMYEFNMMTSFVTSILALLVCRGLVPFWLDKEVSKDLHYLSLGLGWIAVATVIRTFYWGFFYTAMVTYWPQWWDWWVYYVKGTRIVNPMFDMMHTAGFIYILRAYLEMIPEEERHGWTLLIAPFYPNQKIKRMTLRYLFGGKKK